MNDPKLTPEEREVECNAQRTVMWAKDFAVELMDFVGNVIVGDQSFLEDNMEQLKKLHKVRLYIDSLDFGLTEE